MLHVGILVGEMHPLKQVLLNVTMTVPSAATV
jgi:hypothetical protein